MIKYEISKPKKGDVKSFDGTTITFTSYGKGYPLIFSNGLGMDTSLWMHFISYFSPNFMVITWDYRGHGESEKPDDLETMTIPNYCYDLSYVMDKLEIKSAVHFGHSMGVQTILEFYHLFPERVSGLVPICGSYKNPLETFFHTDLFASLFPFFYKIMTNFSGIINRIWQDFLAPSWLVEELAISLGTNRYFLNRQDFKPYMKNLARIDVKTFAYAAKYMMSHSAEDILEKIKVPTLIIAGEKDYFTPLEVSLKMHQKIPNSELLIVPKGSHAALLDSPELINLRVEKFLKEKVLKQVNSDC